MTQKNTKNKPLNACPYCGGSARGYIKTVESFKTIHYYYVMCTECGASTEQYNTEFSRLQENGKFHVLTKKEAIEKAINDWNNQNFSIKTRLPHMSYKEKTIWYIEKLLSKAWHGSMIPASSPEFKTGWKLRKIAESRELLKLHSEINYDLSGVAKILFNDFHVKDIIYQYLQERDRKSSGQREVIGNC